MSRKQRYVHPIADGIPWAQAMSFSANEALAVGDIICPIGGSAGLSGLMPKMEKVDSSAGVPEVMWVSKYATGSGERGIALPWFLIKGTDTSSFSDGDKVYMDYATPGGYAAWGAGPDTAGTEPRAVGTVLYSHATAGQIILDPNGTFTPTMRIPDNIPFYFGNDKDYSLTFDSATTLLDFTGTGLVFADSSALAFGSTPVGGAADVTMFFNPAGDGTFAIATDSITAGGATADSASATFKTGGRVTSDAVAGTPGSGSITIQSGGTDVTDASGTAGPTGDVNITTGNAGSTAGTNSGASGDINLTIGTSADAATGAVRVKGKFAGEDTPETLTTATPAIDVDSLTTYINSSSNVINATIADGVDGQVKFLVMTVAGNNFNLNSTNLNVTTKLLLNAVGEGATLIFDATTGKWNIVGTTGTIS